MITPTITARDYAAIKSQQTAARASGQDAKMLDAALNDGNIAPGRAAGLVPVPRRHRPSR